MLTVQTMTDRRGKDWVRHATHCIRGHPFDEANTLLATVRGKAGGRRICRTCNRERRKAWGELA